MLCAVQVQFVLLTVVLLDSVQKCSAANGAPEKGKLDYCQTFGANLTCKNIPNVDQLRRVLAQWNGHSVTVLTITASRIKKLPGLLFQNITAKSLRVVRSGMQSLHDESLVGMDDLFLLDLSKNSLTTLPWALTSVKSLKLLYVSKNRISTLGLELAHLSSSLERMHLNGNLISWIHEDALHSMGHLKRISLNDNKIRTILPGLLTNAPGLQQIDLRGNLIEDVENVFDGLLQLHTLKLDRNKIRHIRTMSTTDLPSLETLTLGGNPIDALFGTSKVAVESLSLSHCGISDVGSLPFSCMERLRYLNVPFNNISHIDGQSFPQSIDITNFPSKDAGFKSTSCNSRNATAEGFLQAVDLSVNNIGAINDAFHHVRLLETLNLRHNRIEFVADDAFRWNANLKKLDIGYNRVSWLGNHAFRGLERLQELTLFGNRLRSLNRSLTYMPRLSTLRLENNQLMYFGADEFANLPRLRLLYAGKNNISDVRGAFRYLGSLHTLSLPDNDLKFIHRASLPKELKNLENVAVAGNPITCDCQLSWLYQVPELGFESPYPVRIYPSCQNPPWLSGTPFLSNETKYKINSWERDCDDKCTCTCQPNDYHRSIEVNCSSRSLRTIPRLFPEETTLIDLSGNLLTALEVSLTRRAPMLQNLSLANNFLASLDFTLLPKGLRYLSVENNSFQHFPIDVANNLNLSGIWLSGNPWACECQDYGFRQWAEGHENTIMDANTVRCSDGSSRLVASKLFLDLEQKDLCPSRVAGFVTYGMPVLGVLVLCLAVTMVCLKFQRRIKIWLYAHGFRWVKEYDLDNDKTFDVFLSFSSKDSEWAYANLLAGLEETGFSVCTYERNFKGGFLLQDIIEEAVACSRRTLLLLTQNFVESEWCRWEFRVAHRRALQDNMNRLVVVVRENVPENIDEDLSLYMQTTNYLKWGENNFWDKLKYSLPKKGIKRDALPESARVPISIFYKNNSRL